MGLLDGDKTRFVSSFGLPEYITDEMIESAVLSNFNFDTETVYYKDDKLYKFLEFDGYVLIFKEIEEEDSLAMVDPFKAHLYFKKEK